MRKEPDSLRLDGEGYAHPRCFGPASHLGLVLDRPSIGCAKSRLVGAFEEPERDFGAHTPLVDRGEVVGAAGLTRSRRAPLVVSSGHALPDETALALALSCCRDGAFLATPARLAHEVVTAARGG